MLTDRSSSVTRSDRGRSPCCGYVAPRVGDKKPRVSITIFATKAKTLPRNPVSQQRRSPIIDHH